MARLELDGETAFERRFADLLREYARAADGPIDVSAIAEAATMGGQPSGTAARWLGVGGQRWRSAVLVVALLGALAVLIGSALVLGTPPRVLLSVRFSSDELLATVNRRDGGLEIVAISVLSGEPRVITSGGTAIAISPDRARFLQMTGTDLRVNDARGNDLAKFDSWDVFSAVWSPDNRLVLIAGEQGFSPGVAGTSGYIIWDTRSGSNTVLPLAPVTRRANTPGPQFLAFEADQLPEWAPDGAHVLLPTDAGLVVSDLDGHLVRLIPETSGESVGYWSPAGDRILVEDREHKSLVLLAVSPDFATTQVAEVAAGSARQPAWSPDGDLIAYVSSDGVVLATDGGARAPRVVYRGAVIEGSGLHWAPDGSQLAFIGWTHNGVTRWLSHGVYVVDIETGNARVVMSPYRAGRVDW